MGIDGNLLINVCLLLAALATVYWGYLAWFRPEKLKEKLLKDAERKITWPFSKEFSINYTEKYSVTLFRFNTVVSAIFILIFVTLLLLGKIELQQ